MNDTTVWLVVAATGLSTMALKAVGPVFLGGRPLPPRVTGVVALLGPALLAGLVAITTFGEGQALTLDERLAGVAVGAIAIWRRAPVLLVVLLAAATAALLRAAT